MSRYEPFEFADGLSQSAKSKIPEGLRITGGNDPEILLLIRLLSGNLAILVDGRRVRQKVNYFSPSFTSFKSAWGRDFPLLISEGITINDIDSYIRTKRYVNKSFYREILYETLNFFMHKDRGSHTAAFIYLYRLLERVSYCFPLIYVSMTDDFKKTYNVVKTFFGDAKDKDELGFFKTFIDTIFSGDEILSTTVDFSFSVPGQKAGEAERLCALVKKTLTNEFKNDGVADNLSISVKYANVGRFIIILRNSFFHNLSRKDNINAESLQDSDQLFRLVNDQCLYWIASILLAVISYNISTVE